MYAFAHERICTFVLCKLETVETNVHFSKTYLKCAAGISTQNSFATGNGELVFGYFLNLLEIIKVS